MAINGLVSVIIPLYNGERYIAQTITSVLQQTYQNFEIIVVDDCSTDTSHQIVEDLARYDTRIRQIVVEANFGGPAGPRNIGIENALGDYIAFLDADDIWKETKLQKQVEYLNAHPDVTLVYSLADIIDEHSVLQSKAKQSWIKESMRFLLGDKTASYYFNLINNNTVMLRREGIGRFNENRSFHAIEDWIFYSEILQKGAKIYRIDEALIDYRVHAMSISNRTSDRSYRKIYCMYSTFFLDNKISLRHFIFANILNTCKLLKRRLGR